MTKKVLVLAASFSLREEEPNPCNWRIAIETMRICRDLRDRGDIVVLVAQWEVGLALRRLISAERLAEYGFMEIGQYADGRYLGTVELYQEAKSYADVVGASHITAVANPFIHLPYLYWLARSDFELRFRPIRWIGFDSRSTQWWCRSWYRLLYYTVKVAVFKDHGHNNRQAQA